MSVIQKEGETKRERKRDRERERQRERERERERESARESDRPAEVSIAVKQHVPVLSTAVKLKVVKCGVWNAKASPSFAGQAGPMGL